LEGEMRVTEQDNWDSDGWLNDCASVLMLFGGQRCGITPYAEVERIGVG